VAWRGPTGCRSLGGMLARLAMPGEVDGVTPDGTTRPAALAPLYLAAPEAWPLRGASDCVATTTALVVWASCGRGDIVRALLARGAAEAAAGVGPALVARLNAGAPWPGAARVVSSPLVAAAGCWRLGAADAVQALLAAGERGDGCPANMFSPSPLPSPPPLPPLRRTFWPCPHARKCGARAHARQSHQCQQTAGTTHYPRLALLLLRCCAGGVATVHSTVARRARHLTCAALLAGCAASGSLLACHPAAPQSIAHPFTARIGVIYRGERRCWRGGRDSVVVVEVATGAHHIFQSGELLALRRRGQDERPILALLVDQHRLHRVCAASSDWHAAVRGLVHEAPLLRVVWSGEDDVRPHGMAHEGLRCCRQVADVRPQVEARSH
jgi:hypothetical protein